MEFFLQVYFVVLMIVFLCGVTACVAGFIFLTFITVRQTVEDSKNKEFYR